MSVLAMAEITLSFERDISSVHRFYKIAASTTTPAAWTASQTADYIANGTIVSGWSLTEPAYDNTTTNSLYFFDLTVFSDNTYNKTDISKSSSYEAAKQAYVEAKAAQDAAAAIEQYFWHDSSGAHVTKIPKEQFVANPSGSNTLNDSQGLDVRDGNTSLARFGATTRVGKQSSNNVSIEPGGIYLNNENGYSIFSAESSSSKTSVFTTDGPFSQTAGSHTATFSYIPVSGTQITAYIVFDSTRDIYDFTAGQSKTVTKTFGDEVYTIKYNGAKTITITANSSSLWCYVQYAYYYASVKAPVLTCGTDMRGENGRGAFSSAFGEGLEAASKHQFVVGKFNINDPTSFFEVGNGANNDDRNTAFKVMGGGYGQFTGSAATLDMLSADSNKVLRVLSNTNGNRGLYLPTEQKWIARADTNGAVYINGTNLTFPTSGAATLSRDLSTSGYISLSTNGKQIFFADKDNTARSMIWLNGSNYFGLGYGTYEQNYGDTRIYGHNLRFYSHNTITMSQPLIVTGHDTAIGYVPNQENGTLTDTASSTDIARRTDANIALKAGSWVITGTARFTNNSTGRRSINLYVGTSAYEATFVTVPAASGATTKIQTTLVTAQSSDFTVYMGTQQNSSSKLNVDWYLRAIRIA